MIIIIKSITLPCICTSDQSSQKNNKIQSWKSSINRCYLKCLLFFFLFQFQKTDLDANLYSWVSWESLYHSLSARHLKEQSNGFRNWYKTGRESDKATASPFGMMLHFRRIQKREYPHEKGPMYCAKALWSSGDISQCSLDSGNLKKQCWNDTLLRTSDRQF